MSDILRQIDEDLRKERLSNLWKKYGIYSILLIVSVILIIIGYQVVVSMNQVKNEKLLEKYLNATNSETINQQLSFFEELTYSNNNFLSSLAELRILNLKIENGNSEVALVELEKLIKNKNNDPIISDLATYLYLLSKIDEISEDQFMSYLNENKIRNSKFKFLFTELILIKKALDGKVDESKQGFQKLINLSDSPIDIKTRAKKFIEILN